MRACTCAEYESEEYKRDSVTPILEVCGQLSMVITLTSHQSNAPVGLLAQDGSTVDAHVYVWKDEYRWVGRMADWGRGEMLDSTVLLLLPHLAAQERLGERSVGL